jgi:hypothetical protein
VNSELLGNSEPNGYEKYTVSIEKAGKIKESKKSHEVKEFKE